MLREPPDILITTPESLYLMLTSPRPGAVRRRPLVHRRRDPRGRGDQARRAPRADARAADARRPGTDVQRIGLSATQKPLDEIGRFLVGPSRECRIVDTGVRKQLDLKIHVPVESMVEPDDAHGTRPRPARGGAESTRRSIWPAMYPELLELIEAHRSTIVFVNNRRGAERLALRLNELAEHEIARAHHGSLAREERLVVEEMLKAGELPCLVATSSLELGIDMGAVDLVIQVESPKSVARGLQRIGRAGHTVEAVSEGRIFPKFRADLLECAVVAPPDARRTRSRRRSSRATRSTCSPSRSSRSPRPRPRTAPSGRPPERARHPNPFVRDAQPHPARERARHARRALPLLGVQGAPPADRVGPGRRHDPGPPRRPPARDHERRHDPRPRAVRWSRSPTAAASASSTRRWSTRRAPGTRSCSARAPGGSRRSPATA